MPIDRHTSEDEFDRNEDIRVDDNAPPANRSNASKAKAGKAQASKAQASKAKASKAQAGKAQESKSRKVTSAAATATDKTDKTPASKTAASKVPAKKRTARKTTRRTAQNRPGRTARSKEAALKELAQRQLVGDQAAQNLAAKNLASQKAPLDKAPLDKAFADKASENVSQKQSERAEGKTLEARLATRAAGSGVGQGVGQGIIWSLLALGLAACGGGTNTIRVAGDPVPVPTPPSPASDSSGSSGVPGFRPVEADPYDLSDVEPVDDLSAARRVEDYGDVAWLDGRLTLPDGVSQVWYSHGDGDGDGLADDLVLHDNADGAGGIYAVLVDYHTALSDRDFAGTIDVRAIRDGSAEGGQTLTGDDAVRDQFTVDTIVNDDTPDVINGFRDGQDKIRFKTADGAIAAEGNSVSWQIVADETDATKKDITIYAGDKADAGKVLAVIEDFDGEFDADDFEALTGVTFAKIQ